MISEQDKQAILNGAYGVTRNGLKVKYLFTSDNNPETCKHLFIKYRTIDGKLVLNETSWLAENFKFYTAPEDKHNLDVIGLWKDKPEPFDLQRALAGEPVKLRGGLKAYIKYVMPSEYKGKYPLNGYIFNPKKANDVENYTWTLEGISNSFAQPHNYDIIGMWKDPEPVSNTVTLTLPCPLKEPKNEMWLISNICTVCKSSYKGNEIYNSSQDKERFEAGFYFGSKEDAEAWLDAMKKKRR